jgi:hypothetical protein
MVGVVLRRGSDFDRQEIAVGVVFVFLSHAHVAVGICRMIGHEQLSEFVVFEGMQNNRQR